MRELGLFDNFTRLEQVPIEEEIAGGLGHWKYASLASMQLARLEDYQDLWKKLMLLTPGCYLNWIADQVRQYCSKGPAWIHDKIVLV